MRGDFDPARTLVLLDRDVREAFPAIESVNEALRVIAKAAKRLVSRGRKSSAKKRGAAPGLLRRGLTKH